VFGSTGLRVSAVGMGCSRLGSFLTSTSDKEGASTVRLALDSGINFFDTSNIYAQGDSERLLGSALGNDRSRAVLTTKAGREFSRGIRLAARIKRPLKFALRLAPSLRNRAVRTRSDNLSLDFTYEHLTAALDASLRRLRTDWVDIFMLHAPPIEVIADAELFHQLGRLTQSGKIRSLGVSVAEAEHAAPVVKLPEVSSVQVPISQSRKDVLVPLLSQLRQRGLGVVGREVFGDISQQGGDSARRSVLREAVELHGLDVVLIGMSSREHLRSNLAALA